MFDWLRNHFVPHEGNDFAPHALQKRAVMMMSFLVLLTFLGANLQSLLWTSSQWLTSTILPAVIVDLTNEERADDALVTLKRNATLDEAAQMKAAHMAKNEYFAHYSPDGVSPWYWFAQADYNFVHAGENLAIHFTDSGEVVEAWMNSPTHRANIMNGNYREIGVGTAEGSYQGHKTVYVVQLFGTPAATPAVAAAERTTPPVPTPTPTPAPTPTPEPVLVTEEQEDDEPVEVASEAVAITEDVQVFEAAPVAVTSTIPVAETELAQVETTQTGVALFSDHISTSTGGIPANIEPDSTETAGDTVPYVLELATQPNVVLQIVYTLLALFIVGSLTASILIEMRKQQPVQIAYGVMLLLLMAGLWSLHIVVTTGALIA